jgi:periplasmic divalent cation tolerance protein
MYITIKTTIHTKKEAKRIANILLEQKLAACIQIKKVESLYRWQGKTHNEKEYELSIKTKKDLYSKIEEIIIKNHSYQVPQIIAFDIIEGYDKYLNWIYQEVEKE